MTRMIFALLFLMIGSSCAPFWVVQRVEDKLDRLVQNTNRSTLSQVFGDQASVITHKMNELNEEQREAMGELMAEYERGASSLDDVRSSLLAVMGGGERIVSSRRGIWVRNPDGEKVTVVSRNTKLQNCKPLNNDELPDNILAHRSLMNFSWGVGEFNDEEILFPWDLTMSKFTKEIVENTARQTAEEFIRLGGEKAWNRPINIQVITEPQGKGIKIAYPGEENEIYVSTDRKEPAPENEDDTDS